MTYNEGKSVAAERFIRTLKNKIFKHMAAVSKNVCFDVLDDIVDEQNNTYHRTIKMKPIEIKSNSYAECNVDSLKNIVNFKLVIMLEFQITKKCLQKDILVIGEKKLLLLAKLKIQFHGVMLLMVLMVKKLLERFMKKNFRRLIKKNLELKK